VFSSLKNFCASHPDFSYHTLNNYLSKKKVPFETGEIKIERLPVMFRAAQPDFQKSLFWEFDLANMDWMRAYRTVIERVVEQGNATDWDTMINFYGQEKVIQCLMEEIPYLTDIGVEAACQYFHLSPKELRCYTRKKLQQTPWI
jgi:hypothetical protein